MTHIIQDQTMTQPQPQRRPWRTPELRRIATAQAQGGGNVVVQEGPFGNGS